MERGYYTYLQCAYVRGYAKKNGKPCLSKTLIETPLERLTDSQIDEIVSLGKQAQLKLYKFKDTHGNLPRVKRVLGILKSIYFESLLDVGSGRGVFLFPFLNAFSNVDVTAIDVLDHRIEFLNYIVDGGFDNLRTIKGDICDGNLQKKSIDVVTMLEVLEHIPNVQKAIDEAVKIAKNFVIVSVPSKEDNNPEHIHLLTKEKLTKAFNSAGCKRLTFDGVNGHLILIANVGGEK